MKANSIFLLVLLLTVGCQQIFKNKKENKSAEIETWSNKNISLYISKTNNEKIKSLRDSTSIGWCVTDIQKINSIDYLVFRLVHHGEDMFDTSKNVIDGWVYIDMNKHKLYEYDSVNNKLIEWKN